MAADPTPRKLTAILAADVAGYSRLTGADEEGTLARIRALRAEVVDPVLAANRGHIANTAGDSLLVEFASAVDAVRAGIEIRRATALRNADFSAPSVSGATRAHNFSCGFPLRKTEEVLLLVSDQLYSQTCAGNRKPMDKPRCQYLFIPALKRGR
jgi:hypothetical protein